MTGPESRESRVVTEGVSQAQDKAAKGLPMHWFPAVPGPSTPSTREWPKRSLAPFCSARLSPCSISRRRPGAAGLGVTGFAVIGFLVGLRFTALGGHLFDVAYHVTLLPVFAATLIVLLRMGNGSRR
jgi:hypothetical protein